MHILLTRPLEDSKDLILKFKSLGHSVSHLPVIEIKKIEHEELNYSEYKGIIFTSSNAVKNLNSKNIDKKIYCFCVGSATEKFAKKNGYQNIYSADGNVNNLKEIILQNFDKKKGKLLYVSGETISSNLDKDLLELKESTSNISWQDFDNYEKLKNRLKEERRLLKILEKQAAENYQKRSLMHSHILKMEA